MTRKLTLKHERLAELTTAELDSVVGGYPTGVETSNCPDFTYYCPTGYALCVTVVSRVVCP